MKYEMPALTDEQREYTVAECRRLIAESEVSGAGYRTIAKGLVAQIALAALTAGPVAWRHDNGPFGKVATCSAKAAERWVTYNDFEVTPLYTAPPVPALKPIVLPKRKSMLTREDFFEDYVTCMAVPLDEVIAAIRAAGYEVKDE